MTVKDILVTKNGWQEIHNKVYSLNDSAYKVYVDKTWSVFNLREWSTGNYIIIAKGNNFLYMKL